MWEPIMQDPMLRLANTIDPVLDPGAGHILLWADSPMLWSTPYCDVILDKAGWLASSGLSLLCCRPNPGVDWWVGGGVVWLMLSLSLSLSSVTSWAMHAYTYVCVRLCVCTVHAMYVIRDFLQRHLHLANAGSHLSSRLAADVAGLPKTTTGETAPAAGCAIGPETDFAFPSSSSFFPFKLLWPARGRSREDFS